MSHSLCTQLPKKNDDNAHYVAKTHHLNHFFSNAERTSAKCISIDEHQYKPTVTCHATMDKPTNLQNSITY